MSYTFATPSGLITVDHTVTIGRLLKMGAMPAKWADVCGALPVDSIPDADLMRFAARSAEQISQSKRRSESPLTDVGCRPVMACGRAAFLLRKA